MSGNASEVSLEVFSDSGVLQWSGKPLDDAKVVLPIPDAPGAIVLLGGPIVGRFRNVLRVSATGSVVWQAELPDVDSSDAYVSLQWMQTVLVANTLSGYSVRLDAENGRIVDTIFTK
jgi:hypothetical protein